MARATTWISADEVLAEHGYALDPEHRAIYFADGLDGIEHDEHSQSRDHYVAWQRERTLAMLAASDVHPGEYETIIAKLHAGADQRVLEPYDEVPDVLTSLRARGLAGGHLLELGLGSARGGRRVGTRATRWTPWSPPRGSEPANPTRGSSPLPSPRPESAPTGRSSWAIPGAPMSLGPTEAGITPLYLQRDGHWPDATAPADLGTVAVAPDLHGVEDLFR